MEWDSLFLQDAGEIRKCFLFTKICKNKRAEDRDRYRAINSVFVLFNDFY